jgi:hypothetical protein
MKQKITLQKIAIIILISTLAACEKDVGPIRIHKTAPIDSTIYRISYSNYIQPIFNNNCVSCHNANHPFLNLHASVSYDELLFLGDNAPYVDSIDSENSLLIERLRGVEWPIMPPSPPHVSDSDIDSIKAWMQQGCYFN